MIRTAGYTNHWVYTAGAENPNGGFSDPQWDMIVREAKVIIAAARAGGITVTGPMGTGRPSITSEHISLNGDKAKNLDHETFYLVKTPSEEDRRFHQQFLDTFGKGPTREIARGFCKTNGKPYDAVVASILAVANRIGKGVFKAKSDDGALKRVLASTSKQAEWKDWTPDMPVQVVHYGRPPEVFEDLATAQLRYPELNPAKHSSRFTWALRGDVRGRPAIRFEDWAFQRSMFASSNRVVTRHVAAWENLPEGWTEDSLDSFWESLTGDVKHPVTKCIKQMEGKVSDPGAFCGSLADKADPGWRSRGAAAAGGTFRPGDAAVWNGKKVLILDTHGFPAKTVDVRWTESGVSGSRDEVANTKKNVPVSQLTRTASTRVAYNPPFQNAAKADEALGEAYRALIDLKLGFDSWEEIPQSTYPLYQQIMKAVDAVVTARQSTTQVRAMVAKKRY